MVDQPWEDFSSSRHLGGKKTLTAPAQGSASGGGCLAAVCSSAAAELALSQA